MLRLTGLREEEGETEEELRERVDDVLGKLSSKVSATAAKRQGRPGGRKGRALFVYFATHSDRLAVLRTKAELSKTADARSVSIDVVLSPEQQQQKNMLWPMFVQARHENRRAFWRGCDLFIDGMNVQDSCLS